MISEAHIKRFKSIKELDVDCRRFNVFIGEPNTGKSNILEAVGGMFSFLYHSPFVRSLKDYVRFETTSNLFYDGALDQPVEIVCGGVSMRLEYKDGQFQAGYVAENGTLLGQLRGDHSSLTRAGGTGIEGRIGHFKFYRFLVQETFSQDRPDYLLPPSGSNLLTVLLANKEMRDAVNRLFTPSGLRLGLRPHEGKLEVVKQIEDIIISFPYSLASETLQRMAFYLAAIMSNKESILFFEEPESHAFPYYTKYLAERIAMDESGNQYFISTHNPYFLLPLVQKVPKGDLAVNIVHFENHETKVKRMREKDLQELGEIDVFSNLDRYLKRR